MGTRTWAESRLGLHAPQWHTSSCISLISAGLGRPLCDLVQSLINLSVLSPPSRACVLAAAGDQTLQRHQVSWSGMLIEGKKTCYHATNGSLDFTHCGILKDHESEGPACNLYCRHRLLMHDSNSAADVIITVKLTRHCHNTREQGHRPTKSAEIPPPPPVTQSH